MFGWRRRNNRAFSAIISLWLPFLVLIGIWIFFMNRMQGGGRGGAMGFGKSRAKLLDRESMAA
jgi:cell division protease FtsH